MININEFKIALSVLSNSLGELVEIYIDNCTDSEKDYQMDLDHFLNLQQDLINEKYELKGYEVYKFGRLKQKCYKLYLVTL